MAGETKMKLKAKYGKVGNPPQAKTVDVTGLKMYMPPGKGIHPYFIKGGKFNP